LKVFGDEADMYKLEDVQAHDFGEVGEVVITKDDTLFMKVCEKQEKCIIKISPTYFQLSGIPRYL
jgi:chaperonin GroEL